ncbi:S8 family serine peptidase [Paenibacillus glycanilyticus]|uniref:Peptidase S8/S53 domain-containing protein n=1 Tax=Paenibacillus glycanilyticus TaxID=126569 RepID=A0ABQ6G3Y2_9BACL|nr:S8 family serine peptidase [Paenibacillus glycanilyticus]GLX65669.1 hypothetical protein MU1_00130 [Paenibacillus glycanilyticus]
MKTTNPIKIRKYLVVVLVCSILLFSLNQFSAYAESVQFNETNEVNSFGSDTITDSVIGEKKNEYPNGVLVKFIDVDRAEEDYKKKGIQLRVLKHFSIAVIDSVSDKEIELIKADPNVIYYEGNTSTAIAEDTYTSNIKQINTHQVHDLGIYGENVKVAVFDTGIDSDSKDLKIIDGVSFIPEEQNYDDLNGHGTFVSSIIAALRNSQGLIGIAPNVDLYAVKVLNENGKGTYSQVIEGIEWAINNKVDIISMSLVGKEYSKALEEAMELAYENDILLVAPTGNDGSQNVLYPAKFNTVIAVGAVDAENNLAFFSNTGPEVELVAPGVNIQGLDKDGQTVINKSGTSFAVPHVAASLALIKNKYPEMNNKELRNLLDTQAKHLTSTRSDLFGYGLVDASAVIVSPKESISAEGVFSLIKSKESFSKFTESEQEEISDFFQVSKELLLQGEKSGVTLIQSIQIATRVEEYKLPYEEVKQLILEHEDLKELDVQVQSYNQFLQRYNVDFQYINEIKSLFLTGYQFHNVYAAYVMGISSGLPISSLVLKNHNEAETDLQLIKLELPEDEYSIVERIVKQYPTKLQIIQSELENSKSTWADIENKIQNTVKLLTTKITEEQPAKTSTTTSTLQTETPEEVVDYNKYLQAPFNLAQNRNETVQAGTGSLEYDQTNYQLSGRNGLDLTLQVRYNSSESNIYEADYWSSSYTDYDYKVIGGALAYWENWIGTDRYPSGDIPSSTLGVYETLEDAVTVAAIYADQDYTINDYWEDGTDLKINYYSVIVEQYDPTDSYSSTGNTKINDTYTELQSNIGSGWTFGFSSIEIDKNDNKYLHLASGGIFKIKITSAEGDSNLENYKLKDIRLEPDNGTYTNAQNVKSSYVLINKSGYREYFGSNGQLLVMIDRYGNNISFEHQYINGVPVISKITDSLGRVLTFTYATTSTQKTLTITLPDNNTIKYISLPIEGYNNEFVLSKIVDQKNRETVFNYDTSNCKSNFNFFSKTNRNTENVYACLATVTHPTKAKTTYIYEKAVANLGSQGSYEYFRVKSREDFSEGVSNAKLIYDYVNNFSGYPTYTDPSNLPTSFSYSMNITDVYNKIGTDPKTTTIKLNSNHLIEKRDIQAGSKNIESTTYSYNLNKQPVTITTTQYNIGTTENASKTIEYTYDDWGDILTYKDPFQNVSTYTYDNKFHIRNSEIRNLNSTNQQKTSYEINQNNGNVDKLIVSHVENGMDQSIVVNLTYDIYGNMLTQSIKKKDGTSAVVSFTYDPLLNYGYLTKESQTIKDVNGNNQTIDNIYEYYFNSGKLKTYTDGEKNIYKYLYDNLGRLTLIAFPGSTEELTINKEIIYDDTNNIITYIDEVGVSHKNIYDNLGRLVRKQMYKDSSWITTEENHYNQLGLIDWTKNISNNQTFYTYDVLGRIIKQTNPDSTFKQVKYQDAWIYEYNTNRVQVIDESGKSTYTFNDKAGRKKAFFVSDIAQVLNLDSGTPVNYTALYNYDYAGNLISVKDAKGNVTTYSYDDLSRLIKVTNPLLETTRYEYDNFGNLTKTIFNDDSTKENYYDDAGRLIKKMNQSKLEDTFTYDKNGQVDIHIDRNKTKFDYGYNNRGWLTQIIANSGTTTETKSFEYNAAGQRISATVGSLEFSYEYRNDNGSLRKMEYPDGHYVETSEDFTASVPYSKIKDPFGKISYYAYDKLNRLDYVTLDSLTGTKEADYSYTPSGYINQIKFPNNYEIDYQYSDTDSAQLKNIKHKDSSGTIINQYDYIYDKNFNTTSVTSKIGSSTEIISANYDPVNRLSTVNGDEESYSYDTNGNRIQLTSNKVIDISPASYRYNIWNELVQVTMENGEEVTLKYDPDGFLYERNYNNDKTRYYYYLGNIIAEGTVKSDNTVSLKGRYLYGMGLISKMDKEDNKFYYLTNGHGDVVEIINSLGGIENQYKYDVWGNPTTIKESVSNPFKYSGEYWDEDIALQYLGARWYDPGIGRFISEDTYEGTLSNSLSLNLYTYVENNPLGYVDPTGHLKVSGLQKLSDQYNKGYIADANLGPKVLIANGLEKAGGIKEGNNTVFHDIAQLIAAKQVYKAYGKGRNIMPVLEWKLPSGREIDIAYFGQIWEVKPWGQSAEEQLSAYVEEGNGDFTRGNELNDVTRFHIYGILYMGVYFVAPGEVKYELYWYDDGVYTPLTVAQARTYVNSEYERRSKNAGLGQAVVVGVTTVGVAAITAAAEIGGAIAGSVKAIFG